MHTYTHTYTLHTYLKINIHTNIYKNIPTYVLFTCALTLVVACTYSYIRIYMYIRTRTYICILHICIEKLSKLRRSIAGETKKETIKDSFTKKVTFI